MKRPFQLGDWLVQPELNRISGDEGTIQIEPLVMEVLLYLVACAGRVASRRELQAAVWGDTVVGKQSLTRAIWELRSALGDDPRNPHVIETIRKRGYRLIAPVAYPGDEVVVSAIADASRQTAEDQVRSPFPWTTPAALVIGGALLALACVVVWLQLASQSHDTDHSILPTRPLTSFPGTERFPALSPDGTRVAFSWGGEDGEDFDIYVKEVDSESCLRLTDDPEHDLYPAWSPDGATIAFVRVSNPYVILTVPSVGGEIQRLAEAGWGVEGIDWSQDGTWIAYSSYDGVRSPSGIKLLALDTLHARAITEAPQRSARYSWPRFSPDGTSIAFIRSSNYVQKDIYVVPTAGGDPTRLTHLLCPMAGMDWCSDGKQLIVSASHGQDYILWQVSADDGTSMALPTQTTPASHPTVSQSGDRLVYESESFDRDIWRLQLNGNQEKEPEPAPFITSTRMDCCAEYSPDGSRVLFLSARSGHKEVWICDSDGGNLRRVTSLEGLSISQPRWSPDGAHIAFSAFLRDHGRAFVVDVEDGSSRCLSATPRHELVDGWSRDGMWLYVSCSSDSGWCVEKVRLDGTESAPLGIEDGRVIFESMEGDLVFLKYGEGGVWKMPPGGDVEYIVDPCRTQDWTDVTVVDDGMFVVRRTQGREILGFLNGSTWEADSLVSLQGSQNSSLSVSPDRKVILFDRPERIESDVILAKR